MQLRAAFILTQIVNFFGIVNNEKVKYDNELKFDLAEAIIDMLHSPRSTVQIYGV